MHNFEMIHAFYRWGLKMSDEGYLVSSSKSRKSEYHVDHHRWHKQNDIARIAAQNAAATNKIDLYLKSSAWNNDSHVEKQLK